MTATTNNTLEQYARYFTDLAYQNGLIIENFRWSDETGNPFIRCKSALSKSNRALDGSYVARVYGDGKCATFCGFDFHVSNHPIIFEKKFCDSKLSDADLSAIEQEIEQLRQNREGLIAAQYEKVEREIPWILNRCVPCPMNHPYIVKKHISQETVQACGLVMDGLTGAIVVPLNAIDIKEDDDKISPLQFCVENGEKRYLEDKTTSLQFIMADGNKRFLKGGRIKGAHFLIRGAEGKTDTLLICEGLATGDALRQATGYPVVVSFCAYNLEYACATAKTVLESGGTFKKVVVCADNDCANSSKVNTGEIYALKAARKYGFKVAFCPSIDGKSTDFNDLFISKGGEYIDDLIFNATYFTDSKEIDDKEIISACRGGDKSRAELFCRMFRNRFMYDAITKEWHEFKGHRWRRDDENNCFWSFDSMQKILLRPLDLVKKERQEVKDLLRVAKNDEKEQNDLVLSLVGDDKKEERKAAKATLNATSKKVEELEERLKKIEDTLKDIQSAFVQLESTSIRNHIEVQTRCGSDRLIDGSDRWDKAPYVLPVANGILDLMSCTLRRGAPDDRLVKGCDTVYDPNAKCPQWERFDEVLEGQLKGQKDVIDFIQRYVGYSILRHPIEQKLCLFYGPEGRNGKGVFKNVLSKVLGDFCHEPQSSLLTADLGARQNPNAPNSEEYSLRNTALVFMSEVSEKAKFNLQKVKFLTGKDRITARLPYAKHAVTFSPTHSLILLCNNLPNADASDSAFWSRCIVVEFRLHYTENPEKENDRLIDPNLEDKLLTERSGILNWILDGVRKYNEDGLKIPAKCLTAVETYRDDNDSIKDFIGECCTTEDKGTFETFADLYAAYCEWSISQGEPRPMTKDNFGKHLTRSGYESDKKNGCRVRKGIKLSEQAKKMAQDRQKALLREAFQF